LARLTPLLVFTAIGALLWWLSPDRLRAAPPRPWYRDRRRKVEIRGCTST